MISSLQLNKPRLTVLLGAGFSQSLKVPGTKEVGKAIDDALSTKFGSGYVDLRQRLKARFGKAYNFEIVAAALEACEPYGGPGYIPGSTYLAVQPDIAELRAGLDLKFARDMYELLMFVLVQQISIDWELLAPAQDVARVSDLFRTLGDDHRLDIATLNYDDIVETLVPDLNDGFEGTSDKQSFSSAKFLADDQFPKIAHLHGSLRYGVSKAGRFEKNTGDLSPRRTPLWHPRADGSFYVGMVTGTDKPQKMILPPYSVYFMWLGQRLLTSPRMIVCGYGVGDVHVNVWLANAARHHGGDYRMVIVDFFKEDKVPEKIRGLFAYAAGFESGVLDQSVGSSLKFVDGIATLNGAMLVRAGLPLSATQMKTVSEFIKP